MLAAFAEAPTSTDSLVADFPWHVLRAKVGREIQVHEHLQSRGVPSHLPTFRRKRQLPRGSHHKAEILTLPLFSGYVFAAFAPEQKLMTMTVPNVYELLSFGGVPSIIDHAEMDRIRAMSDMAGIEPWERLTEGARVRIVAGPLSNQEGRLLKRNGTTDVVIEVTMLNRSVKIKFDPWAIEAS